MTLHTGRLKTLLYVASILVSVSCENRFPDGTLSSSGKGLVSASLHKEITIKSAEPISEDFSDYNFRYVGVGDYGTSEYYRFGDIVWPMEWYFGIFRLQAESCTAEEAEVGRGIPRYEGMSRNFDVVNDRTASASVVCSPANCRVQVVFEDNMFTSFSAFKMDITSVVSAEYDEEGNMTSPEVSHRTLTYDALNSSGYFNLHPGVMNIRYTLYIQAFGAEEFIEYKTGWFMEEGETSPAQVERGDAIIFRVKYTGETVTLPGMMFIVSGERFGLIDNNISIGDYTGGNVEEDK